MAAATTHRPTQQPEHTALQLRKRRHQLLMIASHSPHATGIHLPTSQAHTWRCPHTSPWLICETQKKSNIWGAATPEKTWLMGRYRRCKGPHGNKSATRAWVKQSLGPALKMGANGSRRASLKTAPAGRVQGTRVSSCPHGADVSGGHQSKSRTPCVCHTHRLPDISQPPGEGVMGNRGWRSGFRQTLQATNQPMVLCSVPTRPGVSHRPTSCHANPPTTPKTVPFNPNKHHTIWTHL